MRFLYTLCITGLSLWAISVGACNRAPQASETRDKKLIVCTTTMIADLARQMGGEHLEVIGIMKTGTDPHIYDPTPDDSIWFRKADLVLANGLHLEGKMIDMIETAGNKALELGKDARISLRASADSAAPDPHVWWNVKNFIIFAEQVRDAFKKMDPAHAEVYEKRAVEYINQLKAMDKAVTESIASIPAASRYMITSHDAFYYFGEAYGIEVDAVLGISTDAQAKAEEPARLAKVASERKIPAIFHETSVSQAQNELVDSIRRLAEERYKHPIKIAGPLFSDSLGHPGTGTDTYIGAVKANTRMIVEALGGTATEALKVTSAG